MKSICVALAGFAVAAVALPASAAIVYDGWQLNDGAGYLSTNIGHLNLSGGMATVTQQLIGGQVVAGSTFSESGTIYSTSYTVENSPGPTDFGLPQNYTGNLAVQLLFPTLTGVVTSVNPSGFVTYAYNVPNTPVSMQVSTNNGSTWNTVANLNVTWPSGGGIEPYLGGGLANGTTDMLLTFDPVGYQSNLLNDSSGTSLDPLVNAVGGSQLQLFVHTQNTVPTGAETIINGGADVQFTVNSDGSANLQRVPEPASIFLTGIGLLGLGLGFARRRKM